MIVKWVNKHLSVINWIIGGVGLMCFWHASKTSIPSWFFASLVLTAIACIIGGYDTVRALNKEIAEAKEKGRAEEQAGIRVAIPNDAPYSADDMADVEEFLSGDTNESARRVSGR